MIQISPSVLASDFSRLGQEAAAMEAAGADLLHMDVMDGHFVPNISFGAPVIARLRPVVTLPLDVHLMISEPLRYIDDFAKAGANLITFHVESDSDISQTIARIHSHGIRPGLVLKPATPAKAVFPFLDDISLVLIMTVEPGFGGQKFMPAMCDKIAMLRKEIVRRNVAVDIQVDGGIDEQTAPLAVNSGANILVAGSALFGQPDYRTALTRLRDACRTTATTQSEK